MAVPVRGSRRRMGVPMIMTIIAVRMPVRVGMFVVMLLFLHGSRLAHGTTAATATVRMGVRVTERKDANHVHGEASDGDDQ